MDLGFFLCCPYAEWVMPLLPSAPNAAPTDLSTWSRPHGGYLTAKSVQGRRKSVQRPMRSFWRWMWSSASLPDVR